MFRSTLLVILLVIANLAHAEDVRLKSGIVKSGDIVEKTDQDITLKQGDDTVTIPFNMVAEGQVKALRALPNKTLTVEVVSGKIVPSDLPPAARDDVAKKIGQGAVSIPRHGQTKRFAEVTVLGQVPIPVSNTKNVRMPINIYEVTRADSNLPVLRGPRDTIGLSRLLEMRAMLKDREYEKLNAALEEYQKAFEQDPTSEYYIYDAYNMLALTDPDYEEAYKSWIRACPEEYQPYLAMAQYCENMGWKNRGHRFIQETTQKQIDGMLYYFSKAVDNLEKALKIKPNLLLAYMVRISIANALGEEEDEDTLSAQATELFPYSFLVRMIIVTAKEPRWGGSYKEMEAFAKSAEKYANVNPELTVLYGYIYEDQAQILERNSQYDEALILLDKALAFGDRAILYTKRARICHVGLTDYNNALLNINKSLVLRPMKTDALLRRSKIYSDQGNYEASLSDLQTAELINPYDNDLKDWRNRIPRKR